MKTLVDRQEISPALGGLDASCSQSERSQPTPPLNRAPEDDEVTPYTGKTRAEIPIWFESLGGESEPAVLLIIGQGGQAISWEDEFCEALVEARYRVVRFDNRDSGL